VEDVSRKEQVSYDRVLGALERQICTEPQWLRYRTLRIVGLDEIALKKGHRDFVTIVTGRLADQCLVLLAVLPDRKKDTVMAFLRTIPIRLVQTIERVCCDMYEGFTEAVREELPHAHLVIDRFHVTQHYAKAADQLRQQELKRLKKELPEDEYKLLKGNMWAFRKKKADLRAEERQVLHRLFRQTPNLKRAYQFREQLTALFEQSLSKVQAKRKFRQWITRVQKSGLTCFDAFIKTLETWLEEITNYFLQRDTSGFVEGFNNKIKVLKRRAYGIFNLQHLFQRLYLDLEGYRLFAL